nr:helix-turn-helix domain-containing protein [Ralstonia mannitolilytica]
MSLTPLDEATKIIGSQVALAHQLGVTKAAVAQWKLEGRRVPAEHCPVIERLTDGQVRCEDLRPDIDWAYLRLSASHPA